MFWDSSALVGDDLVRGAAVESSETFVCLDQRLRDAARREGFALLLEE